MQSEELEKTTKADNKEEKEEEPLIKESKMAQVKNYFRDYVKESKITFAIIAILWVIFVVEVVLTWIIDLGYGFLTISPKVLVKMGGNVALLVKFGQIYRLFTATLLHAGLAHIFWNSVCLVLFCAAVEAAFPIAIYLAIYIVGGIQGNMFSDFYYLRFSHLPVVCVGASTSICAIMGLFIAQVYILHRQGQSVTGAKVKAGVMIIALIICSLAPGVDLLGHLGSLLSGIFLSTVILTWGDDALNKLNKAAIGAFAIYSLALMTIFI